MKIEWDLSRVCLYIPTPVCPRSLSLLSETESSPSSLLSDVRSDVTSLPLQR